MMKLRHTLGRLAGNLSIYTKTVMALVHPLKPQVDRGEEITQQILAYAKTNGLAIALPTPTIDVHPAGCEGLVEGYTRLSFANNHDAHITYRSLSILDYNTGTRLPAVSITFCNNKENAHEGLDIPLRAGNITGTQLRDTQKFSPLAIAQMAKTLHAFSQLNAAQLAKADGIEVK